MVKLSPTKKMKKEKAKLSKENNSEFLVEKAAIDSFLLEHPQATEKQAKKALEKIKEEEGRKKEE